jgi:hypothetical protein
LSVGNTLSARVNAASFRKAMVVLIAMSSASLITSQAAAEVQLWTTVSFAVLSVLYALRKHLFEHYVPWATEQTYAAVNQSVSGQATAGFEWATVDCALTAATVSADFYAFAAAAAAFCWFWWWWCCCCCGCSCLTVLLTLLVVGRRAGVCGRLLGGGVSEQRKSRAVGRGQRWATGAREVERGGVPGVASEPQRRRRVKRLARLAARGAHPFNGVALHRSILHGGEASGCRSRQGRYQRRNSEPFAR